MAKAKRIVLDSMKDHLILHIMKKKMENDTYDALVTPYQSVNINRNLLLKNKLIATCMSDVDAEANYLVKNTQLQDQLAAIRVKIENQLV